jgi:hypothetical protein
MLYRIFGFIYPKTAFSLMTGNLRSMQVGLRSERRKLRFVSLPNLPIASDAVRSNARSKPNAAASLRYHPSLIW